MLIQRGAEELKIKAIGGALRGRPTGRLRLAPREISMNFLPVVKHISIVVNLLPAKECFGPAFEDILHAQFGGLRVD